MRALAAAVMTAAVLAATGARAQDGPVPAVVRTVTPRVVDAVQMKQLAVFDPARNPFKVRPPGYAPRPANDSPEYAERGLGSLIPPPAPVPTDGPLAARRAESFFSYQPRMTTDFSVRDTGNWMPGDCTIAAGPSHLVVAFNSSVAIYDKAGNRLWLSSLDGLLGATAGWKGHFDPKVVYDEGSNRFYLMALDLDLSSRQSVWSVAVSVSSDPNQGWYVYGQMANQWDGEGIDYEDLGFGPRGIYLTGNYISFSDWSALPGPAADHSNALWVMDKAAMLAGQAVSYWTFGDVVGESSQPVFLTRVAQVHTVPFGGVDGFMTAWQNMGPSGMPPTFARVSVWGVGLPGNFPAGAPTLARQTVDTTLPAAFPNAQQSGGPARLQGDNLGAGQLSLYFRGNTLTMPLPVGSGSVSAARVLHLSVVWPTVSLAWQTDYGDGAHGHLWPNVAVNARGQQLLVYCRSGADEFANFRWATRTTDDSNFGPSKLVRAGQSYVGNPLTDTGSTLFRWGDYSGVAVDPVTQGFWMFGMYAMDRGNEDGTDFEFWCGYVPRAVYVDGGYAGSEAGTTQRPFNTLVEGMNDSFYNNEVVVKAGTYSAGGVLSRPVTIIPDGGTVVVNP